MPKYMVSVYKKVKEYYEVEAEDEREARECYEFIGKKTSHKVLEIDVSVYKK